MHVKKYIDPAIPILRDIAALEREYENEDLSGNLCAALQRALRALFQYGGLYSSGSLEMFGKTFLRLCEKEGTGENSPSFILKALYERAPEEKKSSAREFLLTFRFLCALECFGNSLEGIAQARRFSLRQHEGGERYLIDRLYGYEPADRTEEWHRLNKAILSEFFAKARVILPPIKRYFVFESMFFSLGSVRRDRNDPDTALDVLLGKLLQNMASLAKTLGSVYLLWVAYVQGNNFGYFSTVREAENALMSIEPDFDSEYSRCKDAMSYIFKAGEVFPYAQYREAEREEGSLELKKYFISLFEKTDWTLERYVDYAEHGETNNVSFRKVLTKKIEEKILSIAGMIVPDRYEEIYSLLDTFGVGKTSYQFFMLYGTNTDVVKLGLAYNSSRMTEGASLSLIAFLFDCFASVETWREKMGMLFDAEYLALLEKQESEKDFRMFAGRDAYIVSPRIARKLVRYVWSSECREFLSRQG